MKDALIHHYVGLQLLLGYNMALKAFTTHLNISHIYELIFTKFIGNRKYVLKLNEQLLKKTSAQNPLDKTYKKKKKMERGVASTSSVPGMCEG